MKVIAKPTEKIEQLKQNLEKRVDSIEIEDGKLVIKTTELETVEKTPGVESLEVEGETRQGLGGSPVEEHVYAKIESERDAVKALLATIEGYNLVILNTSRSWDLRQLKKYNPDIKELKQNQPSEALNIGKALFEAEGLEKIEIEVPDDIELIYREMLT